MNFEYSGSTNSYMVDSENVSLGNYYELSVEYDMNLLDGSCVVN